MTVVIYTARELNEIDKQVKFLLALPPAHIEEQAAGLVTLAVKHLPRLVAQVRELLADDTLNSTFRRILLIKKARDRKQKARREAKRSGKVMRYNLSPDTRVDQEPHLYCTEGDEG